MTNAPVADLVAEIARLTAERDQARAQIAAVIEKAAERMDNGFSYNAGNRVRALTPADAQRALDKILTEAEQRGYANAMGAERKDADQRISKAREDAIREAASACRMGVQEIAEGDWGEEGVAMSYTIKTRILAMLNDGGRDE